MFLPEKKKMNPTTFSIFCPRSLQTGREKNLEKSPRKNLCSRKKIAKFNPKKKVFAREKYFKFSPSKLKK